jgi:hypothetical protein
MGESGEIEGRGWSPDQWLVGAGCAVAAGIAMTIGAGIIPTGIVPVREKTSAWIVFVIVMGSILIGLLSAAYSKGGWRVKVATICTALFGATILSFIGPLLNTRFWPKEAGLPALQPLIGIVGLLALLAAVILAVRPPR